MKRNADNQYREIFQSVFMLRADSLYNGYRRFCVKTIFLEDEEYVICNGDGENKIVRKTDDVEIVRSDQISRSVVSDSLQPHESQHA